MCHSPSGAFRVQAPDRACWALADNATATDSPAASPPDTTFCATRFITDLREKGDSPTDFDSVLPRIDRSGGEKKLDTSRAGRGQYYGTDVQTLLLLEARARLSEASSGETRLPVRNFSGPAGAAG